MSNSLTFLLIIKLLYLNRTVEEYSGYIEDVNAVKLKIFWEFLYRAVTDVFTSTIITTQNH